MRVILFFVISCLALHNGKGESTVLLCYQILKDSWCGDGWRSRFNVEVKNTGCCRDQ